MFGQQFNNAIQAIGSQDWHNWDTINAMQPWNSFEEYAQKIDKYIWTDHSQPLPQPGGGGDPKAQIAKDISDATASVNSISTYENQLSDLNKKIAGYKQTIQDLQNQINALPDSDPRKATALSDLKKAQDLLQTFQTVSDHLVQISNDFRALQDEGNISNPTPDQAAKADALAAEIATFAGQIPASFPGDAAINTMNQAIAQVKTDIASNPYAQQIQKDLDTITTSYNALIQSQTADQKLLSDLSGKLKDLQTQQGNLQKTIDALPDSDPKKAAAIKDMASLNQAISSLTQDQTNMQNASISVGR